MIFLILCGPFLSGTSPTPRLLLLTLLPTFAHNFHVLLWPCKPTTGPSLSTPRSPLSSPLTVFTFVSHAPTRPPKTEGRTCHLHDQRCHSHSPLPILHAALLLGRGSRHGNIPCQYMSLPIHWFLDSLYSSLRHNTKLCRPSCLWLPMLSQPIRYGQT